MTGDTILIDKRFCGPSDSANGGYVCGRIADFIEGPATVRLLSPPPLGVALSVLPLDDGIVVLHQDRKIAVGKPGGPDLEPPAMPDRDAVLDATARYPGHRQHQYPRCFVCGPQRDAGDGLRIFAGPVAGTRTVAAPWVPDATLADENGRVAPAYHWAALDCPGAFTFLESVTAPILLGELSADIRRRARPGESLTVVGWQILHEGRRHVTGTAVFDAAGHCIGLARGTWFELKQAG